MEVIDNTELFKQRKVEKDKNAEVCRVCGSKVVHTFSYDSPTMDCIKHLRTAIKTLEDVLRGIK